MARIETLTEERMDAAQRAACDEAVAGRRGHVPVPMQAWLRNPELARRAQHLGALMRYDTSLPPRLSELAILITARHWTAHYEWQAHRPEALRGGLEEWAIQAIARRERPDFADAPARIVHEVSLALLERHVLDAALYAEAVAVLGEAGLVDLVGVLGYYGLVSMTLNTFELGLPDCFQAELADPAG